MLPFLAFIAMLSSFSFAKERCDPRCETASIDDFSKYIIKIAAYGHDRRQTMEEIAGNKANLPKIKDRFAATGTLICEGVWPCKANPKKNCPIEIEGSAQLTMGAGVITTANHALTDPETCFEMAKANRCTFSIETATGPQTREVASLVGQGFQCPAKPGGKDDWAVMKLKSPVTGVKPYRLDIAKSKSLRRGEPLYLICHSRDFIRNGTKPKHGAPCSVGATYPPGGVPSYAGSDCDAGEDCSGGSILSGNHEDPALLGILTDVSETHDELEDAIAHHKVNTHDYDESTWTSRFVPINGAFLNAIRQANGLAPLQQDSIWDGPQGQLELGTPTLDQYHK